MHEEEGSGEAIQLARDRTVEKLRAAQEAGEPSEEIQQIEASFARILEDMGLGEEEVQAQLDRAREQAGIS